MRRGLAVLIVAALAGPAHADLEPRPYGAGSWRLDIIAGAVGVNGRAKFLAGVRYGYFVLDGLEIAARGEAVFSTNPTLVLAGPELRYVLYPVDWSVRPYVDTFYHHWFATDGYDDQDSVGGSVGVLWRSFRNAEIGLGVGIDQLLSNCRDDCTRIGTTLSVRVSFH